MKTKIKMIISSMFVLLFAVVLAACSKSTKTDNQTTSLSTTTSVATTTDVTTTEEDKTTSDIGIDIEAFIYKCVDDKFLASEATCTEPKKYYYSNAKGEAGTETFSVGEPLGHSYHYEYDENYHWKVCDICGDVTEKEEHQFVDEVIKEPSNGEAGILRRTCKICGYSYDVKIDALYNLDFRFPNNNAKVLNSNDEEAESFSLAPNISSTFTIECDSTKEVYEIYYLDYYGIKYNIQFAEIEGKSTVEIQCDFTFDTTLYVEVIDKPQIIIQSDSLYTVANEDGTPFDADKIYSVGEEVTLVFSAEEGYYFVDVNTDLVDYTTKYNTNHDVLELTFKVEESNVINLECSPTPILEVYSESGDANVIIDGKDVGQDYDFNVKYASNYSATISLSDGYYIEEIIIDGVTYNVDDLEYELDLSDVTCSHNICIISKEFNDINVSFNISGTESKVLFNETEYQDNSYQFSSITDKLNNITYQIDADSNYYIESIVIYDYEYNMYEASYQNTFEFDVTRENTIYVNLAPKPTLTITKDDNVEITIDEESKDSYILDYNYNYVVNMECEEGYCIERITLENDYVFNYLVDGTVTSYSYDVKLIESKTLYVRIKKIDYTISTNIATELEFDVQETAVFGEDVTFEVLYEDEYLLTQNAIFRISNNTENDYIEIYSYYYYYSEYCDYIDSNSLTQDEYTYDTYLTDNLYIDSVLNSDNQYTFTMPKSSVTLSLYSIEKNTSTLNIHMISEKPGMAYLYENTTSSNYSAIYFTESSEYTTYEMTVIGNILVLKFSYYVGYNRNRVVSFYDSNESYTNDNNQKESLGYTIYNDYQYITYIKTIDDLTSIQEFDIYIETEIIESTVTVENIYDGYTPSQEVFYYFGGKYVYDGDFNTIKSYVSTSVSYCNTSYNHLTKVEISYDNGYSKTDITSLALSSIPAEYNHDNYILYFTYSNVNYKIITYENVGADVISGVTDLTYDLVESGSDFSRTIELSDDAYGLKYAIYNEDGLVMSNTITLYSVTSNTHILLCPGYNSDNAITITSTSELSKIGNDSAYPADGYYIYNGENATYYLEEEMINLHCGFINFNNKLIINDSTEGSQVSCLFSSIYFSSIINLSYGNRIDVQYSSTYNIISNYIHYSNIIDAELTCLVDVSNDDAVTKNSGVSITLGNRTGCYVNNAVIQFNVASPYQLFEYDFNGGVTDVSFETITINYAEKYNKEYRVEPVAATEILTAEELIAAFSGFNTGYYVLTADITLNLDNDTLFKDNYFKHLNGANHSLTINITNVTSNYILGSIYNAVFEDIIIDINVTFSEDAELTVTNYYIFKTFDNVIFTGVELSAYVSCNATSNYKNLYLANYGYRSCIVDSTIETSTTLSGVNLYLIAYDNITYSNSSFNGTTL